MLIILYYNRYIMIMLKTLKKLDNNNNNINLKKKRIRQKNQ